MRLTQLGSVHAKPVEVLGDELYHQRCPRFVRDVLVGETPGTKLLDRSGPLRHNLAGFEIAGQRFDEPVQGFDDGIVAARGALGDHDPDLTQRALRKRGIVCDGLPSTVMVDRDEKAESARSRFSELHVSGTFIMPNCWDTGSALVLQSLGFEAIATTSSGFAATLGRHDQSVSLAELMVHVAAVCAAVDIPLSVDAEAGYSPEVGGLSRSVGQLAAAGAAGVSIEDYLPERGLLGREEAVNRVGIFAGAAASHGMTVTARAENHLYGLDDLDDTISRLQAYHQAGAHVVYAPGLVELADITRVVDEVGAPLNVLLMPGGPTGAELASAGVRRVSTGGSLAFAAYGALAAGARELLESGTSRYAEGVLTTQERMNAFGPDQG